MSLELRIALLSSFAVVNSFAFNAVPNLAFPASRACVNGASLASSVPSRSGLQRQNGNRNRFCGGQSVLRMGVDENPQEQPTKKTTGFKNLAKVLERELKVETEIDPATGKTKYLFTSLQNILLSLSQPLILYALYQAYVAAGLPPFNR